MDSMYLDNAATTKPKEEVIQAMLPYFYDRWYNPSSLYSPSKNIKKDIEDARKSAPIAQCRDALINWRLTKAPNYPLNAMQSWQKLIRRGG